MIVCHSFFYKKSPKYLYNAVGLMRSVNNCCFVNHGDFDSFCIKLRNALRDDTGGRFDTGDISLYRGNNQLQIEVKHGQDYAARIDFITVEKGLVVKALSAEIVTAWQFTPKGEMKFVWKEDFR